MDKKSVISFFDKRASAWDSEIRRNEKVISEILDIAEIKKGISVLDVACGTGVLLGDYFSREVKWITAIDISSEMVRIARDKYPKADIVCGDAETYQFDRTFDSIVIYNAFPHFFDDMALFENLTDQLADGGRLTVAHGMSREQLLAHHAGKAHDVSVELVTAEALSQKMNGFVAVDTVISNKEMYVVSGIKK